MTAKSAYHLLAKLAGAACNLGCQYGFFLSKENLYPARESPPMPGVLEATIRQLMELSFGPRVEDHGRPRAERALRRRDHQDAVIP